MNLLKTLEDFFIFPNSPPQAETEEKTLPSRNCSSEVTGLENILRLPSRQKKMWRSNEVKLKIYPEPLPEFEPLRCLSTTLVSGASREREKRARCSRRPWGGSGSSNTSTRIVCPQATGRLETSRHLTPSSNGYRVLMQLVSRDRSSAPQIRPTQGTKSLSDGPPATVKLTQPSDILIRVCRHCEEAGYLTLYVKRHCEEAGYLTLYVKRHCEEAGYLTLYVKRHCEEAGYLVLYVKRHCEEAGYLTLYVKRHCEEAGYLTLYVKRHCEEAGYLTLYVKRHCEEAGYLTLYVKRHCEEAGYLTLYVKRHCEEAGYLTLYVKRHCEEAGYLTLYVTRHHRKSSYPTLHV
ncbi:hypothetical protein RRG08_045417 [Elysia crispata]|uniref:Uncharacterized protein n=1 Tax=Elysia crispata TaxID=231223 RepID=A0AAE0XMX7_9GAST|nr:hypothetical protein RRG08_045417 [Elysia crispata]